MNDIQLIIPMSGQGNRYRKAGYTQPKPLIPVSGEPMIKRLMSNFPAHWETHFIMAENHRETDLPGVLDAIRPNSHLSYVPVHTKGPSFALKDYLSGLDSQSPVLVSYCDYGMVWDPAAFERFVRDSECDACLVSYRGFHAHYLSETMYAYARMDDERCVEVKEKGCFTDNRENEFASCGAYYFRTAKLLEKAIDFQIERELELGGEYYTSLTVQALLENEPDSHVRIFEIPGFFQWGTPEDLQNFEYWEKTYRAFNKNVGKKKKTTVDQILLPMAGLGSRFKADFKPVKPFIPVIGEPMFTQAIKSLPPAQKTAVVLLEEHLDEAQNHAAGFHFVSLPETPSGQALTCEAGLEALEAQKSLIVSSCDHGIVLDTEKWNRFAEDPDCDAAIFTVNHFPGAARTPKSYAYVVPEKSEDAFPLVSQVSVKVPVSETPINDNVLVGTFWFKEAALMQKGIEELVQQDIRVNGELYLDSIFSLLADAGHKIRMIPLEGYIGWGDPDSLAESLYWYEIFCGYALDKHQRYPGAHHARV